MSNAVRTSFGSISFRIKYRKPVSCTRLQAPLIRRPHLLRFFARVDQYLERTAVMRGQARTWAPNCNKLAAEVARSGEPLPKAPR
jgi:hypothetical protein